MYTLALIFCLNVFFLGTNSQNFLPENFKICSSSDTKCLVEQAQNMVPIMIEGIPELGTKSLDPLILKPLSFSVGGLNMNFTNGRINGYKSTQIDDVRIDFRTNVLEVLFHQDSKLVGKYKANGRLLFVPIDGDGDLTAEFKHLNIRLTLPFELIEDSDGKERLHLKSFKTKFWIKGNKNAKYQMTNLFNGDEKLAKTVKDFIDANGELVTNELGKPIFDVITKQEFKQLKKFFEAVPIDQLVEI